MYSDSLIFEGKIITYKVQRSLKRKSNISIQVLTDKSIVIKSPVFVSKRVIQDLLHKNMSWIIKRQQEQKSVVYQSGALHLFLGKDYRLKLLTQCHIDIYIKDDEIVIEAPNFDEQTIKTILDHFYKKQAEIYFHQRLNYLLPLMSWVKEYPNIRIKHMRSRWGSCASHGAISLNAYLMKANLECIDYVIVHELCHLVVKAHNKEFYALLSFVFPNWQFCQQSLKKIVL